MSLEQYCGLLEKSQQTFGVQLPKLVAGKLHIESGLADVEKVHEEVKKLQPTDGWVMYRDKLELSANLPKRSGLLEAEYAKDGTSLRIQLLHGNQYRITRFEANTNTESFTHCYSEQRLYVRNNLKGEAHTALYRLWYKQEDFRWQTVAQQFIGFCKEAGQ